MEWLLIIALGPLVILAYAMVVLAWRVIFEGK
jgi:hypothetical protein